MCSDVLKCSQMFSDNYRWSFQMKVWTLMIQRNPMIPIYSMIPAIRWSLAIPWSSAIGWSIGSMNFDNPKVYGDTSITEGLVFNGALSKLNHTNKKQTNCTFATYIWSTWVWLCPVLRWWGPACCTSQAPGWERLPSYKKESDWWGVKILFPWRPALLPTYEFVCLRTPLKCS